MVGSTFDSWLQEERIHEEVTAVAIKAVVAAQIAAELQERAFTKSRRADLMRTRRATFGARRRGG